MHRHRLRALAVAASAVALLAVPAAAGTFHVPSDDYDTIQSAVDVAMDGDTILVGPGTYDETVVVDGIDRLQILGRGAPAVTGAGGVAAFLVSNCEGTRVSGFLVDSGSPGVVVSNAVGARIEKIAVLQPAGAGIRVQMSEGVLVKSCRVENAEQAAFVLQDPAGVRVEKCSVAGGTAVVLTGQEVLASKNRVTGGGGGIQAAGMGLHIVEKNRMLAVQGDGITVAATGNTLENNTVIDALSNGVNLQAAGNTLEKNKASGSGGSDLLSAVAEIENTFLSNRFGTASFP